METRPSNRLIAKWRAEYAADLEDQVQQALKDFDRKWGKDPDVDTEAPQSTPVTTEVAAQNGSRSRSRDGLPTIRQMVVRTLPEPGADTDAPRLRDEIALQWPYANTKHLGSRVSQILKDMYTHDKLEYVSKGPRIQDPVIYRVKDLDEETLLKS